MMKHRLFSMLTAASVMLTGIGTGAALPAAAETEADLDCVMHAGSNQSLQNTDRYATTVKSSLLPLGTGWMRVQGALSDAPGKIRADFTPAPTAAIMC